MRKFLSVILLCALPLLAGRVLAQDSPPKEVVYQTGAPTGSTCTESKIIIDRVTGTGYVRVGGACQAMPSGSPGGSNGQIQYNNNGAFGGLASVPVSSGGTGQTSYTNGQLLIGNTTGNTLTKATLTAGSNISITNGGGSITIASTAGSFPGWSDTTARTIAASSTQYLYLFSPGAAANSTESNRQQTIPDGFTLSRLYITTISAQPNDGALTCLVRNSTTTTDTSLSITIAPNGSGTFSDTTHSVSGSAGDKVVLKCTNASASASAAISDLRFVAVRN